MIADFWKIDRNVLAQVFDIQIDRPKVSLC